MGDDTIISYIYMRKSKEYSFQVKADKFFPPEVATSQFLYRDRVIKKLSRTKSCRPRIINIEAQAGQGKTTVIKQYLDSISMTSVWYQIGAEDADPASLLKAIHACISVVIPGFSSAATAQVLKGRDYATFELQKWVDLLLNDLRNCLKDDLYFVFDDLHYLIPFKSSMSVLEYLLEFTPPKLHFILSSREPLSLENWHSISDSHDLLQLGNSELALDVNEITDFFHQVHQLDIPNDTLKKIIPVTDGWVMGVLLLGLQMVQNETMHLPILEKQNGVGCQELLVYFLREIFDSLELHQQRSLLVLALLDDIPVDLAIELTGVPTIGVELAELARRNYFIRSLSQDKGEFGMHHLFQQFLREKAKIDLRSEKIRQIYKHAGEYCFRCNNVTQSLSYFLRAKDYDSIELVLKQRGMMYLATNQTATLSSLLDCVPSSFLQKLGWSSFFLALATLDSAPAKALPLLKNALEVFITRRDKVGEMVSLVHIISIHITTTGHYSEGKVSLYRAEELFLEIDDELDATTTILVVYSLSLGYCIFLADIDKATRYSSLGLSLAYKEKLVNLQAAMYLIKGYIEIFAGRTSLALQYIEQAAPYLQRPEVGMFNCLAIRMMLTNFLFHYRDFSNYFKQKIQLIDVVGNDMVSQSIVGPFFYVWEMDIAINKGKYEKSLELADLALKQRPHLSPHLSGQILQLKAVVLALQQDHEQALIVANESQRLRGVAGGLYFVTLNKILVGLTTALIGDQKHGLELLDDGIDAACHMPTEYLESCGVLHRATVHLRMGEETEAIKDVTRGLSLMKRNNYLHFWAWNPEAIEEILTFAVVHEIEPAYARLLAAACLDMSLLNDGRAIPLLVIRILGGCSIEYRGETLLKTESFTPLQREMLCLLLAAPGLKLPQATIQLHFWPDSSPLTVKMKFDTMVSRLRKTLAEVLPEDSASLYLNREKGILWLEHCRVDALDFLNVVKRGQAHLHLQEFWQADNKFTFAESLWQGDFLPGVSGDNYVRNFRMKLTQTFSEMVFSWCEILVKTGRIAQAIVVTENALLNDPLNEKLYGLLYRLQGKISAVLARQVKKRFILELQGDGYSDAEIGELIAGLSL